MADITDEHIKEALSVACEATREGQHQTLGAVARNLELSDDDAFQALRAALDYMLVLGSQREGWGAFGPSMEFDNKVYPPSLPRVPPSWFPIWARAFSCAPYMHIRARFADLLWEAKHGGKERYKWGQRAIDAYLSALNEPFGVDVYLVEGACRALDLTRRLGDKKRGNLAIAALRHLVRMDIENSDVVPGTTIRSLATLVDLPQEQHPEYLGELIDTVLQRKHPLHVRLACLELKLMLAETQEEQRDLWEAQVNAHADEGRPHKDLARFIHFQNAIQLAEKHGFRELANELQQEVGPLSKDSFQQVETADKIPAPTMEKILDDFVGDDNPPNALCRFGEQIPSGDPEQNRDQVQESMNEFPLRSLMTNLLIGDHDELIKQTQTREEFEKDQVVSLEAYNIDFFGALAVHILKTIRERYGAIGADARVFEGELVDQTQAEWMALAVRHYEAGDYRSSVSVMAPRVENAIRGIAQRVGIVILRDSKGGKRVGGVKDLAGVLAELKGRIPEAIRRYWRTLLVESRGLNLRDRVAHGLLDTPTPQEAAILIHAACHLSRLKIRVPTEGDGPE